MLNKLLKVFLKVPINENSSVSDENLKDSNYLYPFVDIKIQTSEFEEGEFEDEFNFFVKNELDKHNPTDFDLFIEEI